jgi:hypothetical protein
MHIDGARSSKTRKFVATDGATYMWRWRASEDFEWSVRAVPPRARSGG